MFHPDTTSLRMETSAGWGGHQAVGHLALCALVQPGRAAATGACPSAEGAGDCERPGRFSESFSLQVAEEMLLQWYAQTFFFGEMDGLMENDGNVWCQGLPGGTPSFFTDASGGGPWKQLWLARRKLLQEPDEVRALVAASSLPKSAKDWIPKQCLFGLNFFVFGSV